MRKWFITSVNSVNMCSWYQSVHSTQQDVHWVSYGPFRVYHKAGCASGRDYGDWQAAASTRAGYSVSTSLFYILVTLFIVCIKLTTAMHLIRGFASPQTLCATKQGTNNCLATNRHTTYLHFQDNFVKKIIFNIEASSLRVKTNIYCLPQQANLTMSHVVSPGGF